MSVGGRVCSESEGEMNQNLITVKNEHLARLLCNALFNCRGGLKAGYEIDSATGNCDYTYRIVSEGYPDRKIMKAELEEIRAFCYGFAECWRVV